MDGNPAGRDYTSGRPEPREPREEIGDLKPKISPLDADKKKKIKTKKMEKFLGLGGSSTSAENPTSSTSQGNTGTSGGTGDIKTNLGNLLGGK